MKILHLPIKSKYFWQIYSGSKKIEYREFKPYWQKRIDRSITHIKIKIGYSSQNPSMIIELNHINVENIMHEFFGESEKKVYALHLGNVVEIKNIPQIEKTTGLRISIN